VEVFKDGQWVYGPPLPGPMLESSLIRDQKDGVYLLGGYSWGQ